MCGLLLLVVNYLNCCYTFLVQAKLKYITTMKEFYVSLNCFKFVIFALFYFGRLCALVYVTQFELSPLYENVNREFAWITISTFSPFTLTGFAVNVKIFTPRQIDQQAGGSVTRLCEEASVRSGKWGWVGGGGARNLGHCHGWWKLTHSAASSVLLPPLENFLHLLLHLLLCTPQFIVIVDSMFF